MLHLFDTCELIWKFPKRGINVWLQNVFPIWDAYSQKFYRRGRGLAKSKLLLDKATAESNKCFCHAWISLGVCCWQVKVLQDVSVTFFFKCWTHLVSFVSSLEPIFVKVSIWIIIIIMWVKGAYLKWIGHFRKGVFIWSMLLICRLLECLALFLIRYPY